MFWKNKKVLITGHTGFKGSWLSLWLQSLQANVIGYALEPPTSTNLFVETGVAKGMMDVRGDVRNYHALHDVIKDHQPEIIIHMAAQSLVRYSYSHPVETYATNVMGTVNLLEAVRHSSTVRAVVNVTTDKCYENKEWNWGYRENEPLGGFDPYSNSKACSELVTDSYRNAFFQHLPIGLATARAGNVIGGGDWAQDRIIPDLIQSCIENKNLKIRYPKAIRPWQHVLEPLSGYLQLAQCLYENPKNYSQAWNFGPSDADSRSVEWIADHVLALWGGQNKWEQEEAPQAHEAGYLKLDCAKAEAKLGWKPRWNIHQTLNETLAWYRAYYEKQAMREVTLNQIKKYEGEKNAPQ